VDGGGGAHNGLLVEVKLPMVDQSLKEKGRNNAEPAAKKTMTIKKGHIRYS
jgi:hypothetical protein